MLIGPLGLLYLDFRSTLHASNQCLCWNQQQHKTPLLEPPSISKQQHNNECEANSTKTRPSTQPLMCLPRNSTRCPRLNGSLLLQTASSTRRLRLRGKFLQRFHRDTILERGLVRGMKEDPTNDTNEGVSPRSSFTIAAGREVDEERKKDPLRHDRVILPFCSIHRLLPSRRTQTPFAARLEADRSQIIPT